MGKAVKLVLGLCGALIMGVVIMGIFRICPPQGPWPMPPWCDSTAVGSSGERFSYYKPGTGTAFFDKPVYFTGDMPEVMLPTNPFLNTMHPDGIHWGAASGMGIMLKPATFRFQGRNMHYIGAAISPMHWSGSYERIPEAAALDLQGNPIPVIKPGMPGAFEGDYWMNLLDPLWQNFLISSCKKMIDTGVEGIMVDESTFNREVIYMAGGSFDTYSMNGFREYLKEKYSPAQLRQKYNIGDIDGFNYRDYIFSNNLQDTWNSKTYPPSDLTLTSEFAHFQLMASADFWRHMSTELKQYSSDKYNREFFFSISASPQFTALFMPLDIQDYLTGEHFYFMKGSDLHKAATVIKMGEELLPRTVLLTEVSQDRGAPPAMTNNMFKYIFADIYSADGRMTTPGASFLTMVDGYSRYVDNTPFDPQEAARYVQYARAHPEFYNLNEPAQVAVVHSLASRAGGSDIPVDGNRHSSSNCTKGVLEMLLNLHVPVSMIVSGEQYLNQRDFSLTDLQPFKVVILPDTYMLSDSEVQSLLQYVRQGGRIIAIGSIGTHDKEGRYATRTDLQNLTRAGEYRLGTGSWLTIREDLGSAYWLAGGVSKTPVEYSKQDPAIRKFQNDLYRYYNPEIVTDAPVTVNIRRYLDDNRMVLHLVNYDYNHLQDTFNPAVSFSVTVTLPPGFSPTEVFVHDFEAGTKHTIDITLQGNQAGFTISSLYSYTVVELK